MAPPSPSTGSVVESVDGTARRILSEVLRRGPVSRAELSRRLDLSTASLTRLTKPLVLQGLLVEGEPLAAGAGRPSLPLDVAARYALFLGVKLVGDALYAVVTDVRGQVLASAEQPLPDRSVPAVIESVGRAADQLRRRRPGVVAAGIAVGGPVRDARIAADVEALGWPETDLGGRLAERLQLPTLVINDALAFTQAEHWFGVGRDADPFLVVTVGFGVGCFVVVNDQVIGGDDHRAGWVQHLPLDPDGPRCDRGHRGCPIATLTTAGVLRELTSARGRAVDEDEIGRLVDDPVAAPVLRRWGRTLGRLVAVTANLLDPGRILVSGEGAGLVPAVRDAFDAGLADLRRPGADDHIAVAALDFSSWARGAAVAAVQRWVLG